MKRTIRMQCFGWGISLVLSGCALFETSPPPAPVEYIAAQPVIVEEGPVVMPDLEEPPIVPGQMQKIPTSSPEGEEGDDRPPHEVIQAATDQATDGPEIDGYFNAISVYNFEPGRLYRVYCAPLRITDIQLQPGEEIMGTPGIGDSTRWVSGVSESEDNGVKRQHFFIKPTRAGLHTTLVLTTNKRVYHLELHSYKNTYMVSIKWRYPHEDFLRQVAKRESKKAREEPVVATNVNLANTNFEYAIEVIRGNPRWTPVQTFDDGHKTFIRFPKVLEVSEAPALFLLPVDGDADALQLVNYRVKENFYVVDRLFQRARLIVGTDDQEIVEIVSGLAQEEEMES
ncbi:MAG: P-type conjugative transfer protein TrbG [Nitrospirales bacterium]|nr:P-type conjugative transfer protein TrbG [Nitrospirales bacterium]